METFLHRNTMHIFLITKAHLTNKSFCRIRGCDLINSNYSYERAHGGCVILIKSSSQYEMEEQYVKENFRAAIIFIHIPFRHNITCDNFFQELGPLHILFFNILKYYLHSYGYYCN